MVKHESPRKHMNNPNVDVVVNSTSDSLKERQVTLVGYRFLCFIVSFICIAITCSLHHNSILQWYAHHDNIKYPYSSLYAIQDGSIDTNLSYRSDQIPCDARHLRLELLSPRRNTIAAFDSMMEWKVKGEIVSVKDHFLTVFPLSTANVTRSLTVSIWIDGQQLEIPDRGIIDHATLESIGVLPEVRLLLFYAECTYPLNAF